MELSSSQLITLEALSGPQKGQKAEVTKTPLTLGALRTGKSRASTRRSRSTASAPSCCATSPRRTARS
jgi:hypothetical protein